MEKRFEIGYDNFIYHKIALNSKGIVLGGWVAAPGGLTKNQLHQTVIIQFDSIGNKLWQYETDPNEDWIGTIGGLVTAGTDNIVYVSAKGTLFEPDSTKYDEFIWDWSFTKMDQNQKIIWRTKIGTPLKVSVGYDKIFWNLLKLKNKGGYITVGKDFQPLDTSYRFYGWLAKVGIDGEFKWQRRYNVEDKDNIEYELRDIKEDKDGNLITSGERRGAGATNRQQGWLMKLDSFGCLIPGCQLVGTSDPNINVTEQKVLIYPNPAGDFISFIIKTLEYKDISYRIVDVNGKIIKNGSNIQSDVTYLIHASEMRNGNYFIQFYRNNNLLTTKKIIISH